MMEKSVEIDQKLCTGCGSCIRMCPAGIIYLDKSTKTAKISDEKRCDRLAGCVRVCKAGAIKVDRQMPSFAKLFGF
jgi:NAD-dependent dihydropyrimidine dehydrogenase PreA subunit